MAKKKVNVTINGIEVQVPEDYTVLMAAREAGIDIPTLCYLKDINEVAACRLCVCEAAASSRSRTAWSSEPIRTASEKRSR